MNEGTTAIVDPTVKEQTPSGGGGPGATQPVNVPKSPAPNRRPIPSRLALFLVPVFEGTVFTNLVLINFIMHPI